MPPTTTDTTPVIDLDPRPGDRTSTAAAPTRPSREEVSGGLADPRATLFGAWRWRHSADLSSHLAHHGAPPLPSDGDARWPERFASTIEASGLTGRGGASFPSATKLRLIWSAPGHPTLVVNAMESEPASAKDKALLSCVPHLVLDGAELAATAVGARRILVCVAGNRHAGPEGVTRAVAERVGTPLAPVPVEVVCPPGRYIAGEESALVSWLNGASGAPSWRPDKSHPLSMGRGAALVHNAETLAHMALIARYGPASFRAAGVGDVPGTALVTVSGDVEYPAVYEVAMGTSLGDVIYQARPLSHVPAVLSGGFGGAWIPTAALAVPYAPGPMASVGGVVGAGVLVVLGGQRCGITETARLARYMAGESAGQCGPCVFGLPAVADDLERLATGNSDSRALKRLKERLAAVDGRGACRHPDGVVRMVRSALSVFAADVDAHGSGSPCPFRHAPSVFPSMMDESKAGAT
jgi:NADH:ubiquinone oxidoreductase subunit F (NADH-binding)